MQAPIANASDVLHIAPRIATRVLSDTRKLQSRMNFSSWEYNRIIIEIIEVKLSSVAPISNNQEANVLRFWDSSFAVSVFLWVGIPIVLMFLDEVGI